jgi:hypothetical protein
MISYSINWMGPLNMKWIEKHGDDWAMGRIDCYNVPGEPYGWEYGVDALKVEDWNDLADWLITLKTEKLIGKQELFDRFEEETGKKLRWMEQEE